jgi:hypothetical protein
VIRRWIAPRDTTVAISGTASQSNVEGDGIRAFPDLQAEAAS